MSNCQDLGAQVFRAVEKDLVLLGGATFLTEFGAETCSPVSGNSTECIAVMDLCTKHWISWINWPGSQLDPQHLGLSRPYARALAGSPLNASFAHDLPSKRFQLCFVVDTSILASTEIYVDFDFYYPSGLSITHSANIKYDVRRSSNTILVQPEDNNANGQHACIAISSLS